MTYGQFMDKKEVTILDYFETLLRYKILIFLIVFISTATSILITFYLPKTYMAHATLLPESADSGSVFGISGALSSLSMLTGSGGSIGGDTNVKKMRLLLSSRALAENVITKHGFFEKLIPDNIDKKNVSIHALATELSKNVSVEYDMELNAFRISLEAKSPQLAYDLLKVYLDELTDLMNETEFSTTKRKRVFIEKQLRNYNKEFLKTGKALSQYYDRRNISAYSPKINVNVASPLASLNKDSKKDLDESLTVKNIPQNVYWEYLTAYKEILGQINLMLAQQYESSKIEESRKGVPFKIIDNPLIPKSKFKPKRKIIVVATFILSCMIAIFLAFTIDYIKIIKRPKKLK